MKENFQLYSMKFVQYLLRGSIFALNHTNYARWLTVYNRDMESLNKENPSVAAEFRNGHFIVQKNLSQLFVDPH